MSWIILVSGILNLFLGVIVWLRNPRERLNYGFALFSLSTVILISFDYIFRFYPTLFILRSSYAFATLVPLTALIWVLQICKVSMKSIPAWKRIVIFIPNLFFFVICYVNGFIVEKIDYLTVLGYHGQLGPLFIPYALFLLLFICTLIYLLYQAQKKSDGILKLQLRFILAGITSYGFAALFFSLILPTYFNVFSFTLLDAPSLILFVGFTAYAILRLHFLNIKILATETLVFTLSMFIFIRTILSVNIDDIITNSVLFFLVIITGIFLIRSVIKEVEQREKIESLAKQLDSLVHLISHEVKGALGKNRDVFGAILEGDLGTVSDQMKGMVSVANDSTKHTVEMVMDILNSSNAKNGTLVMYRKPFDMKAATEEVAATLGSEAQAKGLTLKTEIPDGANYTVDGDREKIVQHVIRNLIDNSIRYTPSGTVTVSLTGGIKDSKNFKGAKSVVLLSIKDTGIGITSDDMSHLFTEGGRGKDSVKVNVHSTGYGLFFAKNIVEANGGKIWAESAGAGKGSQFFVEFPAVVQA